MMIHRANQRSCLRLTGAAALVGALALVQASAWADHVPGVLINGDFETGDLTGWSSFVTPNGNITPGFPLVEPFDVDGDGEPSAAAKLRVGQDVFDFPNPAGGGIEQTFDLAAPGDQLVTARVAVALEQNFGNTQPGRFDLIVDGVILDTVDFNGITILPGDVLRGELIAELADVMAGQHTIRISVTRSATNTRLVFQYIDDVAFTPTVLPVAIDVKPRDPGELDGDLAAINPLSNGLIPVAILGSDSFEVFSVNAATLAFGSGSASPAHRALGHLEDVNDDGFLDLVSHYRTRETDVRFGDTEVCVTGETLDGTLFEGCETIETVPS